MAKTPVWKDVTSYSRGDTQREPKTFELQVGKLRLWVTRHIHIAKDSWRLELQGVFDRELPGNKSADEAKEHCLMLASAYLRTALEDVIKALEATEGEAATEASLPADTRRK